MQVIEAHGARIPTIGLGTMTLKDDVCIQAVKTALQIGYRHLDTAAFYGNEKENGEGLRQSGIKREDVFICTKVRYEATPFSARAPGLLAIHIGKPCTVA